MNYQNLLSKVKDPNFLSLAGNGSMAVLGLVIMGTIYRTLSVTDNGSWLFFQSSLVFIDTFRTGFLMTPFVKFYSGSSHERKQEVIGSAWHVSSLITISFVIINIPALFLFNFMDSEGMVLLIKWFSINLIITLPSLIAMCIAQGELRFDKLLYLRIFGNGLFLILILILISLGKANLDTIVYANLLSSSIASLIALFAGWTHLSAYFKRTIACSKELYHFGKYTVGTSIGASMFKYTDTLIIHYFIPNALAIYTLGNRLMEVVEIPLRSFAATALPKLSAAFNQNRKNDVIKIMQSHVGMLTIILIPVFIGSIIFADLAVSIIGGKQYIGTIAGEEAANVLRLFMGFALIYPADRFFAVTLDAIHQQKINFIKVLIMLAINILSDLGGVYVFGNVYGITIATICPILTGAIIGYWAIQKYQPFSILAVYKSGYTELKHLYQKRFTI